MEQLSVAQRLQRVEVACGLLVLLLLLLLLLFVLLLVVVAELLLLVDVEDISRFWPLSQISRYCKEEYQKGVLLDSLDHDFSKRSNICDKCLN